MNKKYNQIFEEVLKRIEPSEEERDFIEDSVKEFLTKLKKEISKLKSKPEIFIGGSYAKKTLIRKDRYDIDIFIRYGKEYNGQNLSEITGRLIKNFRNVCIVHGSRDYYRIDFGNSLFIELVPVKKVDSPAKSDNITDLSHSHVKYLNKKLENKKVLEDIKIAKTFCHANNCYGAESYIQGFSGYALELLVYHYGGFVKMINGLSKPLKMGEDKIVIDIEKNYKAKKDVLLDMNSSKLKSPVILVDPTYPKRNALAALSGDTFERFKKVCKEFLRNPSIKYFERKKVDLDKLKERAKKDKKEFILIEISTAKQEGDIAGSKLLKFYNHFVSETERFFQIQNKGFNYNGKKSARIFLVLSQKKEIIYEGPLKDDLKHSKEFRKEHKKVIVKKGRLYASEKIKFNVKEFVKKWKLKNKKKIIEMSICDLKII